MSSYVYTAFGTYQVIEHAQNIKISERKVSTKNTSPPSKEQITEVYENKKEQAKIFFNKLLNNL